MTEQKRRELKQEKWNKEFQRKLAAGELIYMGAGRYIDRKLQSKIISQSNNYYKNKQINFLGECEHPKSVIND